LFLEATHNTAAFSHNYDPALRHLGMWL